MEGNFVDISKSSDGLGFDRVEFVHGATYKDNSTVIIVPGRDAMIHHRVVQAWQGLIAPMNQKRSFMFCIGHEVGIAYNTMIQNILAHPELSKWKYIMTLETDNLPPPDAHIRLLESIEQFKFDAVSGIYFTKGMVNMPMAYGNHEEFQRTGVLDFKPLNIVDALKRGTVLAVNGIAMGCALWRMDLFREFPPPWYVTVADIVPGKGVQGFTQDLWACERFTRAGKRLGVDFRVKVGHIDLNDGLVY